MEMAKAEESLKAAELCYAQGVIQFFSESRLLRHVSGAQVALETSGFIQPEWSHVGLHATFANELTRRRKHFAPLLDRDLPIVQELRHTADYRTLIAVPDRQHARSTRQESSCRLL
jgi:hypothetical protein